MDEIRVMNQRAQDQKYKTLFYKILRIRMVEEELARRYPEGKMRCPTHWSIGQEAVPVIVCDHLTHHDFAVSSHRAHAHFLAKGGSLKGLIAELYGKETGCTQGRGGSMNLSDLSAGFVASTAIVGNTIPVGVGLAFSQQLKKTDTVTCIFLGDAAVEEGAFYESLNFAVLRKLPVIFICENNFYSVNTPISLRQPKERQIFEMARGIGAKAAQYDGNDVFSYYDAMKDIFADLRENSGPWFLEFHTYRYKVHCGPDDDLEAIDRPREEIDFWLAKDPVAVFENQLRERDVIASEEIEQYHTQIKKEIDEAFIFAENSSAPLAEARFLYKYADSDLEWLEKSLTREKEGVCLE